MDKLKTVRVKNTKNAILQVPSHVVETWGLQEGDSIDMFLAEDGQHIVLSPRKGYLHVRPVQATV